MLLLGQPRNVCYGLFLTFSSFSHFEAEVLTHWYMYIDTYIHFAWAGRIFKILIFRLGGQDDDCCCTNIRRLLATLPHVLHRDLLLPRHHGGAIHSGTVFGYLLAGNEQFHVQSDYILLDEFTVSSIFPESVCACTQDSLSLHPPVEAPLVHLAAAKLFHLRLN